MGSHVRRIESLVPRRALSFGAKAMHLAALARAGFPVPAAFAVAAEACEEALVTVLGADELPSALLAAPATEVTAERLADIAARVRRAPLPAALASELREAERTLRAEGAAALAVRSSSLREDERARSAAGMHESVLGVVGPDALQDAVRAVWASAFDPRVLAYLRALGASRPAAMGARVGMGVLVQAMVPSEVAGVLFTVNPLSADSAELVLEAAYGLGASVVDGRVSPDIYRVGKASGWVRDRVLGDKAHASRWTVERGLHETETPAAERARPALSEEALGRLVDLGVRIEEHFGDARDVEWAVVGRSVFVLQARPVTAVASPPAPRRLRDSGDRARLVWSNVNVGEALPGVVTPFTWSVLSGFSERGFRHAFGALGCTVPKDAELVGHVRGRIYLNLSEFMAIASQVPGLRPGVLLSLGGGGLEALDVQVERRSPSAFLARLPFTAARFARENLALGERTARFEAWFSGERARIEGFDLRLLSSNALHRVLSEVERLLDPTGDLLLNVYGSYLAAVVALRSVLAWRVPEARVEALLRDLLTGLTDVESAAPGVALQRLAEVARTDAPAREWLLASPAESLRAKDCPAGPTRRGLDDFFARHGGRGAREAEIAAPRWREDPTLPFATLRLHLQRAEAGAPRDPQTARRRAERELDGLVPFPLRPAVRTLLALVQHFTRLRERLRGHVVVVLGLYRSVGLDASRRLAAMEPGLGPDAAFFLSVSELHAVLEGRVESVGALVRRRRQQHRRNLSLPPPPDAFVGFPPPVEATLPEGALRGLGASGGRAVGRARVVLHAHETSAMQPGEVLVVQQADVGWTPLFLAASAIVTDLGGALSHASVVAREYGVPAVVNTHVGTRVLATGDEVEVDGDEGLVRVLRRAGESAHEERVDDATSD